MGFTCSCGFPDYELAGAVALGGSSVGGTTTAGGGQAGGGAFMADAGTGGGLAGASSMPPGRGCTEAMLVCLRMDQLPDQEGWSYRQDGEASALVVDGFAGNHVLRFTTRGSEAQPGPAAEYSWIAPDSATRGHVLFDFRQSDVGPYTQVVVAQADLGERAIRFVLRSMPQHALVVQLVALPDVSVIEERHVPEASFFDQMRLIELSYTLAGVASSASVAIEGEVVAQLPLGDNGLAVAPTLRFGAVDYTVPSSGAEFEIDGFGFEPK